jgi:diguanylate cyclase (GGDEF)-like protein/PAS domain S-box-containing protein
VSNQALRLIIIEDTLNEAESIVSILKNAGIAVRMRYVEDLEQLNEVLAPDSFDMIFCAATSIEPTLSQTITTTNEIDPAIVIVATHSEEDSELRDEVMAAGAHDLICPDNADHFQMVTRREMEVAALKRSMQTCKASLRESEKRCHTLLDSSRDAITYVHEGMHIYANQVYLDTFGFPNLEEIEGTPIMDMVVDKDHEHLKKYLRMYSKGEHKTRALEVTGLRPNGKTFSAQMEFSPATIEGEPCTQIIIRDQSLNKELESKLKFLSKKDVLTDLYNRQYFIETLDEKISLAHEDRNSRSLLYLEPDNIKFIKETTGISGIDTILRDTGDIIRQELGENIAAARFSDTAFTILADISDTNELMALADKIRGTIESHISEVDGQSITFTCSIGACQFGSNSDNAHDVISQADLACELAHEEGGNCIHLHNPVADEKASRERDIHWSKTIEHALNHNSFSLAYQPIASLHGETSEKYEVLLRMVDEQENPVPPSKFIPAAEEHGMSIAVDRWVIVHTLKVLRERILAGKDTVIFIKLSPTTISDENMLLWISEVLKKSKVDPAKLVFEIHENAVNKILRPAKAFVDGLKKLKCGFCLEHFGTNENSVQILKYLLVDYVKIDGSFMRNLASNQENQAMVKSMTELAQSVKTATIAEFVEDASSLAVLWQCGINYIQGNFLQQPQDMMNYDFEGDED